MNQIAARALMSGMRRVTTGPNGDDGRSWFCRFLAAAPTHRYAFCL